jgi:hypothetical protein
VQSTCHHHRRAINGAHGVTPRWSLDRDLVHPPEIVLRLTAMAAVPPSLEPPARNTTASASILVSTVRCTGAIAMNIHVVWSILHIDYVWHGMAPDGELGRDH